MSESDSDLDFESADEDADFDIHLKNNNTHQKKELLKDDGILSVQGETLKSTDCATVLQETKPVDNDDIKDKIAQDCNNSCKEIEECNSSMKDIVEVENAQNVSKKHFEEDRTEQDFNIEKLKTNEADVGKIRQEKRVTLRLEKKIQQKNSLEKDNSLDNERKSASAESNQKQAEIKQSSWGFSTWGTTLLSTAASSVSTFTNQVSQGIGTVLETVENTLGAPSPEELAGTLKQRKHSTDASAEGGDEMESKISSSEVKKDGSEAITNLLPDVSSWTKVLENTGSKVIMGGLDTLELIGKKTFDIINETDPGLRKTRSVFSDGITLSQILREAKAEADESQEDSEGQQMVHYSQVFDDYQGLAHLEALEMLSTQSQAKMQRLLIRVARNAEVRKNLDEIKAICENIPPLDDTTDCEGFEDFVTVFKKYILELDIPFNSDSMIRVQKRISDVVKNYESASVNTSTPKEIYHSAICGLAEFTAKSIETFHKLTELILVQRSLEPDVEHFVTNLTGLTTVMCIEINNLSSRYHHCLDSLAEQKENSQKQVITTLVTNLYVEASNSNKYIQDAFLLLVPVLQVSLLENSQ